MTDDFDVSLRRRLESLAASVPLSAPGELESVRPRGIRPGAGARLGWAGWLPVIAVVVGGLLVAGVAQLGPRTGPPNASALGGTEPPNGPIEASTRSGDFVLTIRSAKARYAVDEVLEVEASLTYDGSAPVQIAHGLGGAGGPVGFGIEEPVLGGLRLNPTTADVCARTSLQPGETLTYGFAKSGSFDGHDPNADDFKRFFEDPDLRLGQGTWHPYAVAEFSIGDCAPDPTVVRADLTIGVLEAPSSTPDPTKAVESEGPVVATDRDGEFELSVQSAKGTYRPDEPIDITAALTYTGPEPTIEITYDDAGPLLFRIREKVFGEIQVGGISDLTCAAGNRAMLERDVPLRASFQKTGGFARDHPDADAFRAWMMDPVLRLPAGTWHITVASSSPCISPGPAFSVEAEITIVVAFRSSAPFSTPTAPSDDNVIPLTTSSAPAVACAQALGGGRLSLNPRTGLGFTKASGELVDVTWPFGFSARLDHGGAVLRDPSGREVAREGDAILAGGGWGDGDDSFTACELDPWAGAPIDLAAAPTPHDACDRNLGFQSGLLAPSPTTGLGIVVEDVTAPVRWPFGYTARNVHGVGVLFDPEDRLVAWEHGLVGFSGPGSPDGAVILGCGDVRRVAEVTIVD